MHKQLLTLVAVLGLVHTAACSGTGSDAKSGDSSNSSGGGSRYPSDGTSSSSSGSGSSSSGGSGSSSGSPESELPGETEQSLEFDAPLAGARFVYVANAALDSLSVIDSQSLGIRRVAVGNAPGDLTTVPGKDTALVINKGSKTASIVRATATDVQVSSVPVVPAVNRISVAPDGLHAVAWYDVNRAAQGTLPGSMQDVSIVFLDAQGDTSVSMSVGAKPNAVVFSKDGQAAFVVGSDGISILRFAEIKTPGIARLLPVPFVATESAPDAGVDTTAVDGGADGGATDSDGGVTDAGSDAPIVVPVLPGNSSAVPEVSVTDDGRYAVARREGSSMLVLIDLITAEVKSLNLGAAITDLDMAKVNDKSFAFAVLRNSSSLVRVAVPEGFTGGSSLTWQLQGEIIGSASISADASRAVLYTTAVDSKRLVLLDLRGTSAAAPRAVQLSKSIRALAITADGKTALVEHKKAAGNPEDTSADLDTRLDRAYGYTMVDLETGRTKLQITPADIGTFTVTPDSKYAFVLLRDKSLRLVQRLELGSFLVDDIKVGSPPVSMAALADTKKVFVSQEHSEGRISFVDWESQIVETVTGFEMNGRILQ